MSEKSVNVTLVKSTVGKKPDHRATVRALGLRKIGATRLHKMTPTIKGMINKVDYLLKVEDA